MSVALSPACKGKSSAANDPPPAPPAAATAHVEEALARIVATCAEAAGSVDLRRKGDPRWEPVAIGAAFRERDWVRTGASAFARIRFAAGGFLDLHERTTIIVDTAITVDSGSLVGVAEGGGAPIVVKAADGSEARIVTAAGAPAAEFRLTAGADSSLEIAVTRGSVDVTAGGEGRTIAAGEASDLGKDRTSAVVKLLGFPRSIQPGVDARFLFAPAMKIDLTWKPVTKAARYHVQVARDTEFRELVLDTDAPKPVGGFLPDAVGVYVWRVAAVDADGRLGEFGFVRRMYLEAEPPRELLVGPTDGAKIGFSDDGVHVTFSWKSSSETEKYRLVIGAGADPTVDTVASMITQGQQIDVRTLGEGSYSWGVYAIHDKVETPIFLAPRQLTIRRQRVKAETDRLWDQSAR